MMRQVLVLLGLLSGLSATYAAPATAQGTPILEAQIAQSNPCRGLPGLDNLDFIRIDSVVLTASGDLMTGQTDGAIGCRTGSGAFLQSDLSANISVSIVLALSNCSIQSADLRITNTQGSAAFLLDAFRAQAEAALVNEFSSGAIDACRSLTTP